MKYSATQKESSEGSFTGRKKKKNMEDWISNTKDTTELIYLSQKKSSLRSIL